MKKYAFNEITSMQYIFLNSGIQVSVFFLSMPRKLAEKAGTDGWIALIIGWAVTVAASLIVIQVMKKHPEGTLFDLLTRYLGNWTGRVAAILFSLYLFYYAYTGLVQAVLITKSWLLPLTSASIVMFLLLIPTYVIARNGLRILGRYAELVFMISSWIPLVYLLLLKDVHWLNMLPVLKEGWKPVFSTVPTTFFSYIGFATTFILYPFLKNKLKASRDIVISDTLTMLGYLFITIICFVYYSPDEIQKYNQPVINMLESIEFKFLERMEMLFIAFFLLIFSLAWIPAMYMGVFCTCWLLGKQDHRNHLRVLWLFIAVGAFFFMPTFNQSDRMNDFLSQVGFGIEYVFPCCLLLYLWMHDRFQWRKRL
ncbi:spore germination protein (amino acid permease) [Paenibacillus sp. V4I3]|uniref:GerAB/ArcD/ProY family transporter n=1 Tax=unclassified Paenibacillus TaxID=185978 RepID=UPI00277F3D86|nr:MULTISPECIES: endospore germination permease [unclassified Paenibacillus]MDQ0877078.1 spore germination protein (amino acid permease) [Paenibacillus sp. V4I3]MDQ0887042.1 spore germination protein (amino acid permease) [Paenibacillus sp. V4I9]